MKNNIRFPDANDLAYFCDIAVTLNLSRSAERLHVGQPALSLALKRLEEQLDTELFFRRNRGLTLTPSGQLLFQRSTRLNEEWSNLVADTKRASTDLTGTFRLGCHTAVAIYALTPFIKKLYSEFPGIQLELRHALSREICDLVNSGQLDFGFVVNPTRHSNLVIRKLAHDEVAVWRAKDYLKDVLIFDPSLLQSQIILKSVRSHFERFVHTSSLEVATVLAHTGAGAAILPTRVAHALGPELSAISSIKTVRDEITFVYRNDIPKSKAVEAVLHAVRNINI